HVRTARLVPALRDSRHVSAGPRVTGADTGLPRRRDQRVSLAENTDSRYWRRRGAPSHGSKGKNSDGKSERSSAVREINDARASGRYVRSGRKPGAWTRRTETRGPRSDVEIVNGVATNPSRSSCRSVVDAASHGTCAAGHQDSKRGQRFRDQRVRHLYEGKCCNYRKIAYPNRTISRRGKS